MLTWKRNKYIATFFLLSVLLLLNIKVSSAWTSSTLNVKTEKLFGGKEIDRGFYTLQTADGGYIVMGETSSYYMHGSGAMDAYLVKFNDKGYIQWQKTYGGGRDDSGLFVQQTTDGGYIFTGTTKSFQWTSDSKVYLVKTDPSGLEQWHKAFGGSGEDSGSCVRQTKDGGFIIAGQTTSLGAGERDLYLIKTDSLGKAEWEKTFGGKQTEISTSVIQTPDGGYVVVGCTNSYGSGNYDIYMVKTDTKGKKEWEKTFGGSDWDAVAYLEETSDGGLIIAGETTENATGMAAYLIKTDKLGNIYWQKNFIGNDWAVAKSVQPCEEGGYLLLGWTLSKDRSGFDLYLVRTDEYGNKLWEKTLEDSKFSEDFSIQQLGDSLTVTGWWAEKLKWTQDRSDDVQVYLKKVNIEKKV